MTETGYPEKFKCWW